VALFNVDSSFSYESVISGSWRCTLNPPPSVSARVFEALASRIGGKSQQTLSHRGSNRGSLAPKNLSEQRREPTDSTHIIMTPSLEIEPGPYWWEASALTITPQLLSMIDWKMKNNIFENETTHWKRDTYLDQSPNQSSLIGLKTVQFLNCIVKLSRFGVDSRIRERWSLSNK